MAAKKKKKKKLATPKKKKKVVAKKRAPAKKVKAKAKAKPKAKAKAKAKKPVRREDRAGHLDPKYAATLRAQSGTSSRAESKRGAFRVKDDAFATEMGEEVVDQATSGEDEQEDVADRVEEEERGGPFVVTTGRQEFADGTDESNPEDAEVEPFPKT